MSANQLSSFDHVNQLCRELKGAFGFGVLGTEFGKRWVIATPGSPVRRSGRPSKEHRHINAESSSQITSTREIMATRTTELRTRPVND